MITTTAELIIASLQGTDGRPFTIFVDRLLRAYGYVLTVPDAEIVTTVRTNVPDGGVDTEVRVPFPSDTTGLFGTPSVWQYKATAFARIQRSTLLDGAYVRQRVSAGDAFRLCLADGMPRGKIEEWESDLWLEAKQLNPNAPGL